MFYACFSTKLSTVSTIGGKIDEFSTEITQIQSKRGVPMKKTTEIKFDASSKYATITTNSVKTKAKISKLLDREGLEVVSLDKETVTYRLPKKWLTIRPNRILSEAQKAEYAERARKVFGLSKN